MKTKFLIPLAGLAMFCACKGKSGGYEVVNNGSSSSADSIKVDSALATGPKLVKTAGINFKVKNVEQTLHKITTLTEGFGGMAVHEQIGALPERTENVKLSYDSVMRITSFSTQAAITVKVPSVKLEKFMDSVATMGIYVTDRSLDITDKSLDYLSAQLKLKSRTELVEQQKKGKVVIKDPAKVLDLKDDMIDEQIGNRQLDMAVKYSTINLNFYENNTIKKEIMANDDPSAYRLPFFKRIGMAVENGCSLFADFIVFVANMWMFILAGIILWIAARYYKSRKLRTGTVKGWFI